MNDLTDTKLRSSSGDPMIGALLGDRYLLIRLLGQGGMGAVYEATHQGLGRRVAVKLLHSHLALDAETVARFFAEARAAATLAHPNIIDAFDVGTTSHGAPYLVLELLEGESLADRLERPPRMSIPEVVALGSTVAEALACAHEAGIVHRDLKPANLFLAREKKGPPRVKVLDFGLAKIHDGPGHTATGQVMGTLAYMAPEQLADASQVDPRADVYLLGIVLYQCLSGALPFEATNLPTFLHQLSTQVAPSLSGRVPGIPSSLVAIVARCLEKDPGRRFGSMVELTTALVAAAPFPDSAPVLDDTHTARIAEQEAIDSARNHERVHHLGAPPPRAEVPTPRTAHRVGILIGTAVVLSVAGSGLAAYLSERGNTFCSDERCA